MEFKIKCESVNKLECKTEISFRPEEYSIMVNLSFQPTARKENLADLINKSFGMRILNFLVICGRLVLTFDGEDQKLISFDDCTWANPWTPCNIDLPTITSLGLCSVHSITVDDDRLSMDSTPKYFFDQPKKLLKIILLEVENQKFYKISDKVIIGITDDLPSTLIIHPFDFIISSPLPNLDQ